MTTGRINQVAIELRTAETERRRERRHATVRLRRGPHRDLRGFDSTRVALASSITEATRRSSEEASGFRPTTVAADRRHVPIAFRAPVAGSKTSRRSNAVNVSIPSSTLPSGQTDSPLGRDRRRRAPVGSRRRVSPLLLLRTRPSDGCRSPSARSFARDDRPSDRSLVRTLVFSLLLPLHLRI